MHLSPIPLFPSSRTPMWSGSQLTDVIQPAAIREQGAHRDANDSGSVSLERVSVAHSWFATRLVLIVAFLMIVLGAPRAARAASDPQYLLFHIFNGAPDSTGVYRETLTSNQILNLANTIAETVRPASQVANRILGFDIGPISMDQGANGAAAIIGVAFNTALATNLAVSIHLDDRMFWKNATLPDGSLLINAPNTAEWSDWNKTPAPPLNIGWLPNTNLAPQMCYTSPIVQAYTQYWLSNVIGPAILAGYRRLIAAGKPQLFAGVFAGWESNIEEGYCALSNLGYSATNPAPSDALSFVLAQHISTWAQYLANTGLPSYLIYTHVAWPTVQPWVAFNSSSQSGWSNYVWPNDFTQIYSSVGGNPWVQAEGSNVATPAGCPICVPDSPSPYSWESYLAMSFNHGATVVNIFQAFQPGGSPAFSTALSAEAIAAYQKFLSGGTLVE